MASTSLRASVALLAGAAAACSAATDVVAEGSLAVIEPDAAAERDPLLDVPLVHGCRPGHYEGGFVGTYASDLNLAPIKGFITFNLVEVQTGEFLRVQSDEKLSGALSGTTVFTADLVGGAGCVEGEFNTTLENGTLGQFDFQFEGPVTGVYDPERGSFNGTWEIHELQTASQVAKGIWNALWVARVPPAVAPSSPGATVAADSGTP